MRAYQLGNKMLMSAAEMQRLAFPDSWPCVRTVKEVAIAVIRRGSEIGKYFRPPPFPRAIAQDTVAELECLCFRLRFDLCP